MNLIVNLDRIYKFLSSNYSSVSGTKFRNTVDEGRDEQGKLNPEARAKVKEMF